MTDKISIKNIPCHFYKHFLLCFFLIFSTYTIALSQPNIVSTFEIDKANIQSKKILSMLSKEKTDFQNIAQGINQLDQLLELANKCVSKTNSKIQDINSEIKRYFGKNNEFLNAVDSKYLQKRKQELISEAATCRLFRIKTKEQIEHYRQILLSTQQKITFTRGDTIYSRLKRLPTAWQKIQLPQRNKNKLTDMFSVKVLLAIVSILFVANVITFRSRQLMRKRWRKQKSNYFFNVLYIFFTFISGMLYVFSPPFFKASHYNELLTHSYLLLTLFFSSIFFINLAFEFRKTPKIATQYNLRNLYFKRISLLSIIIYFSYKIGISLLSLWQAPKDIIYFFETLILIISLLSLTSFCFFGINRNNKMIEKHLKVSWLYQILLTSVCLILSFDLLGYHFLAINAEYILFSLIFIAAFGAILYIGINKTYQSFNYNPRYQTYFKSQFGFLSEPPYIEFVLFNIILKTLLIIGMSYLFAYLIGETSYFIDKTLDYFFYGFHFSGLIVVPFHWLIGLVVFTCLSLLSRKISTMINLNQQFDKDEEEKQVAFAAITLYVGFSFSLIIALLVAGFNFTSLAIIAGALSVGIGLGLQSIVNNFFCGLILLIEKPFKAGDRIKIDNIEGFVKKIRVRSTQILTPAKEDIIIPNSDFITHQVSNYMFQNTIWRVKCSVGVAYGSDIDLVSNVLMDVALSHPEVLKKSPNEPSVLFQEFGDSALQFELWCPIKNVNKKYPVKSELNHAINKAFSENNITIAFPQQDIHIKTSKPIPLPT
jgi:small-conductance mechanosensitive channel